MTFETETNEGRVELLVTDEYALYLVELIIAAVERINEELRERQ